MLKLSKEKIKHLWKCCYCKNSVSQALKYNNKTYLPAALVNYTPLLWLFWETIKGNGAISEASGKEPSTITEVDCWLSWKISSQVGVCLSEQKSLQHEGFPVSTAKLHLLKKTKDITLIIKYLPSMSFPIRFVLSTGKKKNCSPRQTSQEPEGDTPTWRKSWFATIGAPKSSIKTEMADWI